MAAPRFASANVTTSKPFRAIFFFRFADTAFTISSRSSITSHIIAAFRKYPDQTHHAAKSALESASAVIPFVGLNRCRMLKTTRSLERRF
jgi:hypothetical protein